MDMCKIGVLGQNVFCSKVHNNFNKMIDILYNNNNDTVLKVRNMMLTIEENSCEQDNVKKISTNLPRNEPWQDHNEFDKYISSEIVDELHSYNPINSPGYFDPRIKKAR